MKQVLYIFSVICLLMSSCYKDNSNTKIEEINPIIIDFGNLYPTLSYSVFMLDSLRINPLIYKEGLPDTKLTFEWYLSGNTIMPSVIDTTMTLCAYITAPPQPRAYDLRLTVKDEKEICKVMMFQVTVLSPLSEGLIVADTKDEITSDLSLVIDRCFNYNIKKTDTRIYRNAYSDVNKEPVTGLVRDLATASYGTNRTLTVLTDKSIIRGDYYDFVKIPEECDENIFLIAPKNIDATFILRETAVRNELMCVNGLIFPRGTQNGNRKYNFYYYPTEGPDYQVKKMFCPPGGSPAISFDEKNGKILFFGHNSTFYGLPQIANDFFDVNNLKDYECLHLGQINSLKIVMLSRQKSTGKYLGLVMSKPTSNPLDNYALDVFDFSASTEIESATCFATNILEEAIYYATDTKLYSTPIANINSKIQYQVKPGEKITAIKIWDSNGKIDYEDLDPESETGFRELNTTNRMMLVSVYNETTKEGKVVAIPIVNIGSGGLEQNPTFYVEFEGFGRILKIAKQES